MVAVPETPIHKNRRPIPPHDDIRLAWHALHVEAIAVAVPPQPLPHLQLGLGAFAVDARHHAVALFGCETVCHRIENEYKDTLFLFR
jgi:hypothetical protein